MVAGAVAALAGALESASGGYVLRGIGNPGSTAAVQAAQAQAASSAQAAAAKQIAAMTAAAQALQAAMQNQNIARSTFVLNLPNNLGADPRNPGQLLPAVPDGFGPSAGLSAVDTSDPTKWYGASSTVTQTVSGNTVIDTIQQTSQKAILDWNTFNVGANTILNFQQGGSNWIVLNRVVGASTSPSQILGQINALGAVYIVNQNGIIFGGGAQVNVGSLIASSLDIGDPTANTETLRNQYFIANGIASLTLNAKGTLPLSSFSSTLSAASGQIEGNVTVQPGASITATSGSSSATGFIYLFGPNVSNAGTLTAPLGEVALVAARDITIVPYYYDAALNDIAGTSVLPGIRGSGFTITPYSTNGVSYISGTGQVANSGVIATPAGATILNGDTITMNGVISADTTITRNSQVFLDAVTRVSMNGTISILPLDDGSTLPWAGSTSSQGANSVATFTPPSVQLSAYQVTLGPSALISAPGASVAVTALANNFALAPNKSSLGTSPSEQILMQSGATIDVSGLENVQLPASYNIVTFKVTGNELANDPLQRNGPLLDQYISVDIRNTGTRSDGTAWIGTPAADASGAVSLLGRSIDQLLTTGGSVALTADVTQTSTVTLQSGASINVAGGYVSYQPGYVPSTRLIGSDGHVYDISQANPNLTYVGIVGQFTVSSPRWGVSETYISPFGNQVYEPGYIEGYSAGSISLQGTTLVNQASLQFDAPIGPRQAALGEASGTSVSFAVQARDLIPSQGALSLATPQSIIIADGSVDAAGATFTSRNPATAIELSAQQLSGYGLSSLSLTGNDLYLPAGNTLTLASGGTFSATTAGAIDIEGAIVAHGGAINLTTNAYSLHNAASNYVSSVTATGQSDITIGGSLNVTGLWVNDTGLSDTELAGPGYINGGTIALQTFDSDVAGGVTGNIVIAAGGLLDASSGGYVNQAGKPKLQSYGVLAGAGGNITLATYQGKGFDPQGQGKPVPSALEASIALNGTLRSFGFSSGGILTLAAPAIQIGGTPASDPKTLNLADSFFSQGGFSGYVLGVNGDTQEPSVNGAPAKAPDSVSLSANQTVVLQQVNFSGAFDYNGLATGASVEQVAPLVTLPADWRKPVNLTVQANAIVFGAGSTLVTDPGATVSLVANSSKSSVALNGAIVDHGGTLSISSAAVAFGSGATVDLSGTFIASSTFGLLGSTSPSGTLLPGGSLTIDTSTAGAVTSGLQGSVTAATDVLVDVSGAAANIAGYAYSATTQSLVAVNVPSWSDAGTVSINTGRFSWNGSFLAEAGAPQGNRGTLILGGNTIALVPSMSNLSGANTSAIVAAADQLSAFDTVYLSAGYNSEPGGLGFFSALPPPVSGQAVGAPTVDVSKPLQIYGNVNLAVRNRLYIASQEIVDETLSGADVTIGANYVMLAGPPPQNSIAPTSGPRNLVISAQTIDVQSAGFGNFLNVTLSSAGDIRLMSPPVEDGETVGASSTAVFPTTFFGQIVAGGNLTLSAQRIYPVTAVDFEIVLPNSGTDANGHAVGTVTFQSPSGLDSAIPLSAGGSLEVSATNIVQKGNLFAPLGQITLGTLTTADLSPNDSRGTVVVTSSVTLGAGSLTSVSLAGQTVPYGQTEDGTNWFYNSDAAPLSGPPTKALLLKGAAITTAGATIDLTGGGDLQAYEFIAGKGGSVDVLSNLVSTSQASTRQTYASSSVYAILPGKQPNVGAFDIDFTSNLGDKQPLAGQQVYLSGVTGLAAGWYTLYPSHYATLPGAYRVVDDGSALANPYLAGTTLPDGTQIIGGALGQSGLNLRTSGTELFSVQSSNVWQQYSQVSLSSANAYFQASAGHVAVTPVLPIDGGRLSVASTGTLDLSATINSLPAAGGSGGELDISAARIDVVDPGATARSGYVAVDAAQIDAAGFESILIGGYRTDLANGTLITPTANDVQVDLHTTALSAPEVILVAAPANTSLTAATVLSSTDPSQPTTRNFPGASVLLPQGGNVTIDSGTVTATGSTGADTGRTYLLAGASTPYTAASLASALGGTLNTSGAVDTISGVAFSSAVVAAINSYVSSEAANGALLLVSNAPGVTVTRGALSSPGPVTINFSPGQSLVANPSNPFVKYSYTIGPVNLADLGVVTIASGATVGGAPGGAAPQPQVLVINATARSNAINIAPGSVGARVITLTAQSFAIGDTAATAGAVLGSNLMLGSDVLAPLAEGSLTLQALSGGITFDSFQNVAGCASACPITLGDGVTLQNLTLDAPSLVGTGTNVVINAAGTVTLINSGTGTPLALPAAPGALQITASEIDLGGGTANIVGFNAVNFTASQQVFAKGAGSLTIGGTATDLTPVTISTPNLLVGAGTSSGSSSSQFALTTLGNLLLIGTGGTPPSTTQIGGNIAITAGSIGLNNATIEAVAGTVTLHATSGDIGLGDKSYIRAPGYAQPLNDQVRYAPGGKVVLTSDTGNIDTSTSSHINVAQPGTTYVGWGGEIDLNAPNGQLKSYQSLVPFATDTSGDSADTGSLGVLGAQIAGNGAQGKGGIFSLNIKGGLAYNSLDALSTTLGQGGFTTEVDIHVRTGALVLDAGNTLTAQTISLTDDETDPNLGRVRIADGATLNASGAAGGTIEIYAQSVDLFGTLNANATTAGQSGGSITVGTTGTASGAYSQTYGYEILSSAGLLNLGSNLQVNLSGVNTSGAASISNGGSLTLRVPLLGNVSDDANGTGSAVNVVMGIANPATQLIGVKNFNLEAYATWSTADTTTGGHHFDGIIDPGGVSGTAAAKAAHLQFYAMNGSAPGTLMGFVQSGLSYLDYGVTHVFATQIQQIQSAGTSFNVQPGIDLENPLPNVNGGNITVASPWNLAAGTMSNLVSSGGLKYFNSATSAIEFLYRFGLEPGELTLRAVGNINVNASISDGFFDTQNLTDPSVPASLAPWLALTAPIPSDSSANSISPASQADPLASYDLFPATLNVKLNTGTQAIVQNVAMASWSYSFTAGADFRSANPNAVGSLTVYGDNATGVVAGSAPGTFAGSGNVALAGNNTYNYSYSTNGGISFSTISVTLPTMVRTGEGNITIDAARDLTMLDPSAPGVIYSAGINAPPPASANIKNVGSANSPLLSIGNPDGFVEPNIVASYTVAPNGGLAQSPSEELGKLTGPPTAPAFPENGGNVVIRVQQDVLGNENVTYAYSSSVKDPLYQYYAPWIFTQSSGTLGAGAFAPSSASFFYPQTAWWIEFGRFDQGVLSAGGNVTVVAGRDVRDLSVSLPTTGVVTGGLSAVDSSGNPNIPVTDLYGSGNMVIRVGRTLDSGAYYEGSGTATITVAGSVASDWTGQVGTGSGTKTSIPVSTVLAVDTGQLSLTAGGSITITDIINPAEIHLSPFSLVNNITAMDTYGPNSAITLTSVGGNIVLNAVPQLLSNAVPSSASTLPFNGVTQTYPAMLELAALSGSITTPQSGMILTDSPSATLNLLAYGSINLRGGVTPVIGSTSIEFGAIGAGTALINQAFNPYEPNLWATGTATASTSVVLAHADDPSTDLYDYIYAVTGDITGAAPVEIPRPVRVMAGRDIVDLNLTAENIRSSDVSQVIAGRDIRYDGLVVGGGLQIAGPGFFDVEAGRNLGPFLPASADIATRVYTEQGIVSSGDAASFLGGVTNSSGKGGLGLVLAPVGNNLYGTNANFGGLFGSSAPTAIGMPQPLFLGAADQHGYFRGQENFLLPATGSTIVAMFGVAPRGQSAIDYVGVENTYIDPSTAILIPGVNYGAELATFLSSLGYTLPNGQKIVTASDAWSVWSTVPSQLQHMFDDQVFFSELNRAQTAGYGVGFTAVNTMFPSIDGYTSNNPGPGVLGSPKDQLVSTGSLNLLHATIQTDFGGSVDLFGPGGSILVGSLATEPNTNLKLNNLGLLSLDGGNINTFTDQSVLVNSSRVFTEQGGSILMWSSNGDLDAGRGSRTTFSLNPLEIFIDNNDYQTVNPSGLVTGAGIATLATTSSAAAGNILLEAPTGTIDAGDAGIRSSGTITVLAVVVLNATNITATGSVTGVPTVTVPAFTGTTNVSTNTAATHVGPDVTGTAKTSQPSVVIVNIVGYGGGDSTPTGSIGGGADTGNEAPPPAPGHGDDGASGTGNAKRRNDDTVTN